MLVERSSKDQNDSYYVQIILLGVTQTLIKWPNFSGPIDGVDSEDSEISISLRGSSSLLLALHSPLSPTKFTSKVTEAPCYILPLSFDKFDTKILIDRNVMQRIVGEQTPIVLNTATINYEGQQ